MRILCIMKDTKQHKLHLMMSFARATVAAALRKSKAKGKRGGNGSRGNKLKGFIQYTDVDE
ncbi:MAG: hypothetical protein DI551_10715, partial [Micavibrio aeruginosavorus]